MVKSVDFAVRDVMGGVSRGVVSGDGASDFIQVGAGDNISLNLRKTSILKYVHDGEDLQIVLVDGRTITLAGFFDAPAGVENRLFISADGEITPVTLEETGDGVIFAEYGAPELLGKWSLNDQLAFYEGEDLLAGVVLRRQAQELDAGAHLVGVGVAGVVVDGELHTTSR